MTAVQIWLTSLLQCDKGGTALQRASQLQQRMIQLW